MLQCQKPIWVMMWFWGRTDEEELPKARAAEALEALLVWNVKPVLRAHSSAAA
jgi:hypothetical protein